MNRPPSVPAAMWKSNDGMYTSHVSDCNKDRRKITVESVKTAISRTKDDFSKTKSVFNILSKYIPCCRASFLVIDCSWHQNKVKTKKNHSRRSIHNSPYSMKSFLKSLHPDINMHMLHTVLYTFPKELTRRMCLTIKSFLVGDQFL